MSTSPVLVAIDLKEPSSYALDQGLALAKRTGAEVVVVHVIPDVVRVRALFPQLDSGDAIDAMELEEKIREASLAWLSSEQGSFVRHDTEPMTDAWLRLWRSVLRTLIPEHLL